MLEIYRVLKPGGVVLIMLPVIEGWSTTYENNAVVTPEERARHYGQADHVRYYGADVRDRIRAAGFKLDGSPPKARTCSLTASRAAKRCSSRQSFHSDCQGQTCLLLQGHIDM